MTYTRADDTARWICWPKFDMTCVEGGCIHCGPGGDPDTTAAKTRRQILTKARDRGMDVLMVHERLAFPQERLARRAS